MSDPGAGSNGKVLMPGHGHRPSPTRGAVSTDRDLWRYMLTLIWLLVYDDIQANWGRITQILNNASFIGQYSNFNAHNDLG